MLLFRLKKRKKYLFLFELLLLSACAHGILGLLLFVVYQGSHAGLHIDISAKKSRRPALFISCKRPSMFLVGRHALGSGQGQRGGTSAGSRSGANGGRVRRQGSTTSVVEQAAKLHDTSLGAGTTAVEPAKTALVKAKKSIIAQRKESKKILKNKVKKVGSKKQVAELSKKEAEPVPVPKQAKIESAPVPASHVAQVEPKKEPMPQPVAHPIVEEKQQLPVAENIPLPQGADVASNESPQSSPGEQAIEDLIADQLSAQDGYGEYEDYEYVQQEKMREAIVSEIGSRWKPPKGLSKELECELRICVGQGGKVVECAINKPSGVLIYDMAARVAARAMLLPRWAWGKELTIAFRQ